MDELFETYKSMRKSLSSVGKKNALTDGGWYQMTVIGQFTGSDLRCLQTKSTN